MSIFRLGWAVGVSTSENTSNENAPKPYQLIPFPSCNFYFIKSDVAEKVTRNWDLGSMG